jgi:hypothetical protein
MSNQRSMRPAGRGAFFKAAPRLPVFTERLGLSILVLLFFASRADAACYLRLNMGALPLPQKVAENSFRTIYRAQYKLTVNSACGWALGIPVQIAVQVDGVWTKAIGRATETVNVVASTPNVPGTAKARYEGITSQRNCKYDPWVSFAARCPSWFLWWMIGGMAGVGKWEWANGWNTSLIPWAGFDYRAPYPAIRAKMWHNPWYY